MFTVGGAAFTVEGVTFIVGGATQNCYGPHGPKIGTKSPRFEKSICRKD